MPTAPLVNEEVPTEWVKPPDTAEKRFWGAMHSGAQEEQREKQQKWEAEQVDLTLISNPDLVVFFISSISSVSAANP